MNTPPWFVAAVEAALNRYLALDPEIAARLEPLDGKVLQVTVRGIELTFFLMPAARTLRVLAHHEGKTDAQLAGAPLSLLRLALSSQGRTALFEGMVTLDGDTEFGRQLQDILKAVDIDWEEQLARLTGDVLAHQAGNAARAARHWAEESSASLTLDIADYLHEESRQLPVRGEVDRFMTEVDSLRADIERLAARVKRITPDSK